MTIPNRLDEPTRIADPLSEHALSHVMSDLLDNYVETDEQEIVCALAEAGYRANEVQQIMAAWEKAITDMPRCSTCGARAQCLWISIAEDGEMSSNSGRNTMTPSCFQCGDPKVALEGGVKDAQVMAPLGWDPETLVMQRAQHSAPDLADIIGHSDPGLLQEIGEALGRSFNDTDGIVALVRGFATSSVARGFADSYDSTLVKILVDATA